MFYGWRKYVIGLFITLFFTSNVLSATSYNGVDDGKSFGNETVKYYDNQAGLEERANKPLTSDGVEMKTLDGEKSFNATLLCPSTKSYLRIRIIPESGGEGRILIDQDIDTDGTFDFSADAGIFSGICSNGYITCTPGTWQSCQGRRWKADPTTKHIGIDAVGISQLANCTCINNSCGNLLLYNNAEIVLSQLGTGITFALHDVDSSISIAKANYDTTSFTATFFAQRTSGCADTNTGPGSNDISKYYNNSTMLESDGTNSYNNLSLSSNDDPSDIYYYASKGAPTNNSLEYKTCNIKRNISVETITSTDTFSDWGSSKSYGIDHYATAIILLDNNTLTLQLEGRNPGGSIQPADAIYSVVRQVYNDTVSITAAYASTQTEAASGGCWSGAENKTLPDINSRVVVSGICKASGTQYIYFRYTLNVDYKQDSIKEVILDNCQAIANDSTCSIFEESVDNVTTIKNALPTGLTPLPSCKQITGQVKMFDECREWWDKKRTYKCAAKPQEELDNETKSRLNQVYGTAQKNGDTLSYSDSYAKDIDGTSISYDTKASINVSDYNENCIKGCKIRRLASNTSANAFGNATQYQQVPNRYEFKFYKCEETNGVLTCPAVTGDEIIKDCQCINEFAEAATALTVINDAAKDLICSSGQKQ